MDLDKFEKEIAKQISDKIPKFNCGECKEECNCIEIAEAKNNGESVKSYPCLGY